jgi:NADH-quinone oxidoreductase subunit M
MTLLWILGILVAGGLLALLAGRIGEAWPRRVAAIALGADLILVIVTWAHHYRGLALLDSRAWLVEWQSAWIPRFGASFHLAVDGLSLVLIALTVFLGFLSVIASWTEVKTKTGFFYFNLLWVLAGIAGVFMAMDIFLFYFFWELMLVPMYFLIGIWGHERRVAAAFKFFLFTQAGGLAMLLAILGLYFIHGRATGIYTFEFAALAGTPLGAAGPWIMAGFLLAFIVKIPGLPLHTWLPDAHAQAPTAGSVILAGLLLKTGAYGLIRFALPLDPPALEAFAPFGMAIGVAGILYGAKLAFAQSDLKRMVAYTSVSHMGFVLLGIFALDAMALQGVVLQIVCHGISTGALFIVAGTIQQRLHTRDLGSMGGYWNEAPRLGGATLLFALASLGLPGLGNFAAEFLILFGTFRAAPVFAAFASLGLIASTIYALTLFQRIFHGPKTAASKLPDIGAREVAVFVALALAIVWLGLYPQPVLNTSRAAVNGIGDSFRRVASPSSVRMDRPEKTTGPSPSPVSRDHGVGRKGDAP